MSTTQIHITLKQLNEWSKSTFDFNATAYKTLDSFLSTMEMFPPRGLQFHVRPLIVDEGVNPEDLVFWVTDENTGELHHYNPKLDGIFSTVWDKVEVDDSVFEGLEGVV